MGCLFWAMAFISAGLMIRLLGFRRSAAIMFLLAGGVYSVASVYWIEHKSAAFFWFNAPWGTLCIILGFFIDRKRNIRREIEKRTDSPES
jgi:hypothetical protein